jgi:hypothetical protein
LFFAILCGVSAYFDFKNGNKGWAWCNVIASALNIGAILDNVL